jgi:hypothetical protein
MKPAWKWGTSLHNSQDVVAEWQCLMRRWELAYGDYTAMCAGSPTADDQTGTIVSAAIQRAQLNLIEIKRQIDELISRCGQARAASPELLRFTVIETKNAELLEKMKA